MKKNWTNTYELIVQCENCGRSYVEGYYTEEEALEEYSRTFLENKKVGVKHDKKSRKRRYLLKDTMPRCCHFSCYQ